MNGPEWTVSVFTLLFFAVTAQSGEVVPVNNADISSAPK